MPYELKLGLIIGIAILVVIVAIIGLIFINKRKIKAKKIIVDLIINLNYSRHRLVIAPTQGKY